MRVISSPAAMQKLALRWRGEGIRVGFVPTMGYLHAGHVRLMERARRVVGEQGKVVASIYVNPTQFGPREDLSRYPRDLDRDKQLCRQWVDVLFVPTDQEMYSAEPGREHSTYVFEGDLSRPMEGAARPHHFRGVTTIVAKLFNLVLPEVAVFGAKDFQQASVIRRMVRDLNFPVRILVEETVRDADGLALSSRNEYLSGEEREQAVILFESICLARRMVRNSERPISANRLKRAVVREIEKRPRARVDYVEFFNSETLQPVRQVRQGTRIALAVFLGRTRLIDNGEL